MKYMGSMVKMRKPESVKQILQKHNKAKPQTTYTSRPNTGVAMAQPTSGTDHAKKAARGASPGAAAPGVRPHPHHHLSSLALSGSCMVACKGVLRWFPILLASKPTILGYKQMGRAPFTTHHNSRSSLPPLVSFYYFQQCLELGKTLVKSLDIQKESWYDQYEEFFYVLVLIL